MHKQLTYPTLQIARRINFQGLMVRHSVFQTSCTCYRSFSSPLPLRK